MQSFFQFNEKLQKLNSQQLLRDGALFTGDKSIGLNQQQLYQESVDSEGRALKNYLSLDYAEYKAQLNPFLGLGKPDLRETGSFYDAFYVEVDSKSVKFDSTDPKTASLEKKYGSKIFGLTKNNMAYWANQYVIPNIRQQISNLTGLGFK